MSSVEAVRIPEDEPLQEPAGLRRFLTWFTPVPYGFSAIAAIAFLAFGEVEMARFGAVALAVGVVMTAAFLLFRREQVQWATVTACVALLAGALAVGLVMPHVAASVKLAPILVIALALLYLERGRLAIVVVLSGAATIFLGVVEEVLPKSTADPGWFDSLVRIGVLVAVITPTAYLLWLARARLRAAHGRAVSAQAAADGKVNEANEELRLRVGELQQRNREIQVLAEMADLLQASQTADEAYEAIGRSGALLMPNATGAVHFISPSHDQLELVASWGPAPYGRPPFEPKDCWALRRGRAYVSAGGAVHFRCPHLGTAEPTLASLCVPLAAHGETIGILELLHPTTGAAEPVDDPLFETGNLADSPGEWRAEATAFPDDRRGLILTFAEHTALYLANFRLRETLLIQSTRDPLTGLYNRRFMEESLEREIRRAARGSTELAVLMLDLDLFKAFNDSHGHDAGDAKLRALGEFLRSHVRGDDVACRYGGEEFTIILPGASLEDARHRADILRVGIRNLPTRSGGGTDDPVTVSIGLAIYPLHGATGEDLLRAADEALYDAKGRGRDRIRQAAAPRA